MTLEPTSSVANLQPALELTGKSCYAYLRMETNAWDMKQLLPLTAGKVSHGMFSALAIRE